jgi:hypothetical protein
MIESATAMGIETETVIVRVIGIEAIIAVETETGAETKADTARETEIEIEIASKTGIETATVTVTATINLANLLQRISRGKRRNPRLPPLAQAKR